MRRAPVMKADTVHMKAFVGVLLVVGSVMVYCHWMLGVLVLVAGAFMWPMVVREIHDKRVGRSVGRRRYRRHPRTT